MVAFVILDYGKPFQRESVFYVQFKIHSFSFAFFSNQYSLPFMVRQPTPWFEDVENIFCICYAFSHYHNITEQTTPLFSYRLVSPRYAYQ